MKKIFFVILLLCSGSSVWGRTIYIHQSDMPYTFSYSQHSADEWDTLKFAEDLSSSAGSAITISGNGSTPIKVVLDLNGHTLEFGTSGGNTNRGINISWCWNSSNERGLIVQGPGSIVHSPKANRVIDGTKDNICLTSTLANNFLVDNVNMIIDGGPGFGILVNGNYADRPGFNIEVKNCHILSRQFWFDSRMQMEASPIKILARDGYTNNGYYGAYLHHNVIDSAAHTGISGYGKVWIDSNTVLVDARNLKYTYPSALGQSASNAYGIGLTPYDAINPRIVGNTIRSGTKYEGSQGIYTDGSKGTADAPVEIAYNDVRIHHGPSAHYGDNEPTWGLRTRYTNRHVHIHDNYIEASFDTDDATKSIGQLGGVVYITAMNNSADIQIYNNQIIANIDPNFVHGSIGEPRNAYGLVIDTDTGSDLSLCKSFNNYIESRMIPFKFGIYGGEYGTKEWQSVNDTISWPTPHLTDMWGHTGNVGIGFAGYAFRDIVLRNPVFLNGDTHEDIKNTSGSTSNLREVYLQRSVLLQIVGSNGLPVRNANVTYSTSLYNNIPLGVTDQYGEVTGNVPYHLHRWSGEDYTDEDVDYNNITYKVTSGTDNSSLVVTLDEFYKHDGWYAYDSLTLANTTGDGTPGGNPDRDEPAAPPEGNEAPVFNSVSDQNVSEGSQLSFNVSATDDTGIPALSAQSLPSGAGFNDNGNGTGTFTWTPNSTQSGDYTITFVATDQYNVSSSIQVAIHVIDNVPPGSVIDFQEQPGAEIGTVIFDWTAPGADGNVGTVDHYEIYFSRSTLDNFELVNATAFTDPMPSPQPPGQPQSVVCGWDGQLTPGDYYTFAIIAYDPEGLPSPIATTSGYAAGIKPPLASNNNLIVNFESRTATVESRTVDSTYFGSLSYEFQSDINRQFNSNPQSVMVNNPVGGTVTAEFINLSQTDTIFWRCRAISSSPAFNGRWSSTLAFDLENGSIDFPPSTPLVIEPQNGAIVTSVTPLLTIENSDDPENGLITYDFQVYDSAGTELVHEALDVDEGTEHTSYRVPANFLDDDTYYTWRARAYDGVNFSDWTALNRFKVSTLSSSSGNNEDFVAYSYPNPVCFDNDNVTFMLPTGANDLYIQTISGETILLAKDVTASYEWNGTNASGNRIASGVYLWYLSDGKNSGKIVVTPY